jgi:hypothetical protein
MDSETESNKNSGEEINEEKFVGELTETTEMDGGHELKIYYHKEYANPIYGQRGVIEKIVKRILLDRFLFDYEWQEYRGDIKRVETDDLPIQDIQLLYGDE